MSIENKLKDIGKVIAFPFIGALPEQNYLEEKIKWYKGDIARTITATLEIIAGAYLASHTSKTGLISDSTLGDSALFISMIFDGMFMYVEGGWLPDWLWNSVGGKNPNKKRYGSLFLEIPYNIGKKIYKTITKTYEDKTVKI